MHKRTNVQGMKGDSYVNMTRFGNGSGFVVIKSEVSSMGVVGQDVAVIEAYQMLARHTG